LLPVGLTFEFGRSDAAARRIRFHANMFASWDPNADVLQFRHPNE
jgi:hypothetical protein